MSNQYEVLGKAPVAEDLKNLSPNLKIIPLLINVQNSLRLNDVFKAFKAMIWILDPYQFYSRTYYIYSYIGT